MSEKIQKKSAAQLQSGEQEQPARQLTPPPFQLKADPIQREDGQDGQQQQQLPPALQTNFQLQTPALGSSLARPGFGFGMPGLSLAPGLGMPGLSPGMGTPGLAPLSPSLLSSPQVGPLAPQANPALLNPAMNPANDDFAFMQGLRQRLPLVGGLLSTDATLGLWQVDPLAAPFQDQDGNARRNPDGSPMTQWSQLGPRELEEQMRISRMIAERRHLNLGWDGPLNGQGVGASYQWADGRSLSMGVMPTFNGDSTAPMGLDGARLGVDYRF